MQINQLPNRPLFEHQSNYALNVIKEFNMHEAKELSIPIDKMNSIDQDKELKQTGDQIPYRQAVGCLLFLSTVTRPDAAYAVSYVGRFLSEPKQVHWSMVKPNLRYLKRTNNYGLCLDSTKQLCMEIFSDAEFANCVQTKRSTSGYVFRHQSTIISWTSHRQQTVALSTTESEYIAACEAIKSMI
ncbi:uncharacterized protein LOC126842616 [Adelges cooleyi]|uniref:uncharacterized protein LOC126839993 n=1 Tax=Adelges cooleyi TaxID=133065 RepID=UPI00217FA452|nr:uncharacterized protein LOC126839993 [Adelges cooleyi]XP_050435614.1 uncharacterized protein LOC126842616 [Adelges cooleyi]